MEEAPHHSPDNTQRRWWSHPGVPSALQGPTMDAQQFGTFETTRAAFGGHAGYNVTLGGLLVGVEADAMYPNSSTGFATAVVEL